MKSHLTLLTALAIAISSLAQRTDNVIHLKSGAVYLKPNVNTADIDSINRRISRVDRAFMIIQFAELPNELVKQQLVASGIQLMNYISDNAYTASVKNGLNTNLLQQAKATVVYQPDPTQKMDAGLAKGIIPAWAVKVSGTADLWISVSKTFSSEEAMALLKQLNVDIISSDFAAYRVLTVRIATNRILELGEQSFIEYISPIPAPEEPLINNSKSLSRANVLNSSLGNGGRGLKGEGVTMGIGDNADIQYHIDFKGRLINNTTLGYEGHGVHVSGIAAGGGLIEEAFAGYAPKAKIISNAFGNIILNSPDYVQAYNMVVTNNSYGNAVGCENNGIYDLTSAIVDQQAFDLPNLQHVFSSGNSGGLTCSPYPPGFKTVLGGFQSAKNILCVGMTTVDGLIRTGSSKGPVRDGRVKPEVTALGESVFSTWPVNIYLQGGGTSMSSPAVAGGAALLYQRYRQLNSNVDPKSALIKALICNGAADKGNIGPDFKYGFGSMNLLRSITMLENTHYFSNTISNASTQTYSVTIPANTAKLKVLLYWHDPVPSLIANKALVNDLDLEVVSPSSSTTLPLVLDSTAAHVDNAAINGADHSNNIEQIVLNNPASGNYTIKVKGTAIAQNPSQEYFVVYDAIPNSIQLTYPAGGEGIPPGESVRIAWDAYGDEESTFALQFSGDGGSSWNDINNNIAAGTQVYTWTIPAGATDKALIRVIKNATGQSSVSNLFIVIDKPTVSLSAVQCESYININWTPATGATDYEIMMLKGDEMVSIGTTTGTSYSINSLSKDSTYLVSVRARMNGKPGIRAYGIIRQPSDGNCAGSVSDNDLKLSALVSPVSGRKFTSSELNATTPVTIEIKNLDDVPVTGFTAKYSIDGGSNWITENSNAVIGAGEVLTYTFINTANLSAVGNYDFIAVVINNTPDAVTGNDTLRRIIKHINNQPINLATTFLDNLENASSQNYQADTIGLGGIERYDFKNASAYGRLRTFIYTNSGMSNSGSKAITIDLDSRNTSLTNTSEVIGTYNLSGYTVAKELRLDFKFMPHGINILDSTRAWIRGDDTKPWISMYTMPNHVGQYNASPSIEISDSLLKYGQDFSSSFQVKWMVLPTNKAVQKKQGSGLSVDDIRLYEAINDAQLLSIDSPYAYGCGMDAAVPLKITVRNANKNTLSNIPVKYSINGGAWITETISSLVAETSFQYSFNARLNLASPGTYQIKVVVDVADDNVRSNDTATLVVQSLQLVNSFPHIQNFESGNGSWYTEGINRSWAYGTPTSPKINRAASGAKAWKTNLTGNYNDEERSYLYSPCYAIGSLSQPTLSFSAAFDMEDCGNTTCDGLSIQYSEDGITWNHLDNSFSVINGYNSPSKTYWSVQDYTRWHVVTVSLPKNIPLIRLRFAFASDPAVNREGVAIDDIHVYDSTKAIYDGPSITTPIAQTITGGNNWIHFEKDGQLVASIQPNNQNLGATNVKAYIHTGTVRNTGTQYYHNRNITIKPKTDVLADSAIVRFYFLDKESDSLINASGCIGCSKPASAYELGVSKYHDYDTSFENGNIGDNLQGLWSYINSDKVIKVPFQKGYYAEFRVKEFSEFWLNNGTPDRSTPLPVKLFNFSVQKMGSNDVTVNWTVGGETNVVRYEIELARGEADLQNNNFQKIAEMASRGNSNMQQQYSITDQEELKTGARYYRIKTVNQDGSFTFSIIRSVVFDAITTWKVMPNPSTGKFSFIYQSTNNEVLNAQITDAIGKQVRRYALKGNGFLQKLNIDLSDQAAGIYFLRIQLNGREESYKLYKN